MMNAPCVEATGFEPPLRPITPIQDALRRVGWIDRGCETTAVGRTAACKAKVGNLHETELRGSVKGLSFRILRCYR
jgi:hypothetical protein